MALQELLKPDHLIVVRGAESGRINAARYGGQYLAFYISDLGKRFNDLFRLLITDECPDVCQYLKSLLFPPVPVDVSLIAWVGFTVRKISIKQFKISFCIGGSF